MAFDLKVPVLKRLKSVSYSVLITSAIRLLIFVSLYLTDENIASKSTSVYPQGTFKSSFSFSAYFLTCSRISVSGLNLESTLILSHYIIYTSLSSSNLNA